MRRAVIVIVLIVLFAILASAQSSSSSPKGVKLAKRTRSVKTSSKKSRKFARRRFRKGSKAYKRFIARLRAKKALRLKRRAAWRKRRAARKALRKALRKGAKKSKKIAKKSKKSVKKTTKKSTKKIVKRSSKKVVSKTTSKKKSAKKVRGTTAAPKAPTKTPTTTAKPSAVPTTAKPASAAPTTTSAPKKIKINKKGNKKTKKVKKVKSAPKKPTKKFVKKPAKKVVKKAPKKIVKKQKPQTIVKPSAPIRDLTNGTRVCCNKCHPKIEIVTKFVYKIHVQDIPVPVFIKASEVVEKCPADFQQIKNMCVRQVEQKGACPGGWIRVDDNTCLKVLRLKTNETGCPKGKKLVDGACVIDEDQCKEDVPPLKCPKGWKQVGPFHCKKVKTCPKKGGYKYVKGVGCVKVPVKCPAGYKRVGKDKCIQIIYKCPPGFKFDKKKNACVKIKIVIKCPTGYRLIKGTKKCILKRCWKKKCPAKKVCSQGQVWKIKRGKCCASCVDCGCPSDFRAVCSIDGTTYPNECIARCLGATIKRVGPCTKDEPPKEKCPPSWERDVPCEKKCLDEKFEPVCTTGGITLPNGCVAGCFKEAVAYKGKCKTSVCTSAPVTSAPTSAPTAAPVTALPKPIRN